MVKKCKLRQYKLLKYIYFCICILLFTGCHVAEDETSEKLERTGFAFNTTYTITLNAGGSKDLLDECASRCSGYEKIFSRTLDGSELYNINEVEKVYLEVIQNKKKKDLSVIEKSIRDKINSDNSAEFVINSDGSIAFAVSELMYKILEKGLYYSKLSDGKFDITIEPESSLWNFTVDNPKVPDKVKLKAASKLVNYNNAELKDNKLILKVPGMGIELGAIAKGFIADNLKEYLVDNGVTSGTINLGGNVLCIGKKTDGTPFRIGIQQPFADRNEVITAINAEDVSVVSSGIYERYFIQDEKIYHHILDSSTGYPYDNGLTSVTIVSQNSTDGDALSTTCFSLGLDKGIKLVDSLNDVYAVFITEDGQLHYSNGFKELEIKQ